MPILDQLCSDELVELSLTISTPQALITMLKQRKEVHDVRRAIESGALTSFEIEDFVSSIVRDFRPGEKFIGEVPLAALAVCLETIPGRFADSLLRNLSSINVRELIISPRVASLLLWERRKFMSQSTNSIFTISERLEGGTQVKEWSPPRTEIENQHQVHIGV